MQAAVLGLVLLLASCTTSEVYVAPPVQAWQEQSPPPAEERTFRVFLVGDAGRPAIDGTDPLLNTLARHLEAAGEQAAVAFLGDNVLCCGLPDSTATTFSIREVRLRMQLEALEGFAGRIVFVAGNHDWQTPPPDGLARVRRQEAYIETFLDRGNTFLPDDGMPGPHAVELSDDLVLIALDTQWWLFDEDRRPHDIAPDDVLRALRDVVRTHAGKRLLVVAHHPMRSNGRHAGFVPPKAHLFPLTGLKRWAYVPLPVLGSLYPAYIRVRGGVQDLYHPRYTRMRRGFMEIFAEHDHLIYASGHDHSLQYFRQEGENTTHYIVSGAGSGPEAIAAGRGLSFGLGMTKGFVVIDAYRDGSTWMQVWTAGTPPEGELVFQTLVNGPRLQPRPAAAGAGRSE